MATEKKGDNLPAKVPHARGKPPAQIKIEGLEQLGALGCTNEEIAAFFKCAPQTLQRYLRTKREYREALEQGRELGKLSLRRLQMRHAKGNGSSAVHMTIHLSKHMLGQTDKSIGEGGININSQGGPIQIVISKDDAKL